MCCIRLCASLIRRSEGQVYAGPPVHQDFGSCSSTSASGWTLSCAGWRHSLQGVGMDWQQHYSPAASVARSSFGSNWVSLWYTSNIQPCASSLFLATIEANGKGLCVTVLYLQTSQAGARKVPRSTPTLAGAQASMGDGHSRFCGGVAYIKRVQLHLGGGG